MSTNAAMELLGHGAEGRVYGTTIHGKDVILKERSAKRYRVSDLDQKLTKQRLVQEARCMAKCRRAGVVTPAIYMIDKEKNVIYMEKIIGDSVKTIIKSIANLVEADMALPRSIGKAIALMHDADVVHGDLTTSNMMVKRSDSQLVLIDFGLGSMRPSAEDKAVDLYVLERAFISSHPNTEHIVAEIFDAYKLTSRHSGTILEKFEQVRQRGRKRDMIG